MKNRSVNILTRAALLLVLCVAVQQFKNISQFITGPLVNAILILGVLLINLYAGLAIAVLSPLFAFLISPSPIMQVMPQLIPLVMLGNCALVLMTWALQKKSLIAGLAAGSVLKFGVLALGLQWVLLPVFGGVLKAPQVAAVTTMFSWNQLITAVLGSVIAYLLYLALKKVPGMILTKK